MKGIIGIVVAVMLVIVAALVLPRLLSSSTNGPGATTPSNSAGGNAESGSASTGEQSATGNSSDRTGDAALNRLETLLANAEPVEGRTDEQHLANAWAWVRANRDPDNPYNEIEAKILALMDVLFDGEERSALWVMNTSLIEIEMIRALDADGDGVVSDEEFESFARQNMALMGGLDHPYIMARLDTDGDGQLNEEETAALMNMMGSTGAFSGVIARAQLDQWDTNNDGILSNAERESGTSAPNTMFDVLIDAQIAMQQEQGMFNGEDGDALRQQARDELKEQMVQSMGDNASSMNDMMTAQTLMEAMRLETTDTAQFQAEMIAQMSQPPAYMSFDTDSDGSVSPVEMESFTAAIKDYQQEVKDYTSLAATNFMRVQFDNATTQSDSNNDGRLTPDEWDDRISELSIERDQRLFMLSYDLNQDGAVDPGELTTYLDWHKEGSLRADANFDGIIDPQDLQFMLDNYRRQNQ